MTTVPVLQLDPDLGVGLDARRRAVAERACLAHALEISRGAWHVEPAETDLDHAGYGLLVISGVLCRRIAQSECRGAELVGPGDLLRPFDRIGDWTTIPTETSWTVIDDAQIAVLDDRFAQRATAFPEIATGLIRRGLLRSRYLAILIAIIGQRRIETRLNMLFWHLADRFGQVRGDTVSIPVPLTHSLLAELIAARRPSVTTALSRLREQGVLRRENGGWLLRGSAPAELDLAASSNASK